MDAIIISGTHLFPHTPQRTIRILSTFMHTKSKNHDKHAIEAVVSTHLEKGARDREYGMWHKRQDDWETWFLLHGSTTQSLVPRSGPAECCVRKSRHLVFTLRCTTAGGGIVQEEERLRRLSGAKDSGSGRFNIDDDAACASVASSSTS